MLRTVAGIKVFPTSGHGARHLCAESNSVHAKTGCLKNLSDCGGVAALKFHFPVAHGSSAAELLAGIACKASDFRHGNPRVKSGDDDHRFSSAVGFLFPEDHPSGRRRRLFFLRENPLGEIGNAQAREGGLKSLPRTGNRNAAAGIHAVNIAAPNTPALSPSCGRRICVESEGLKTNRSMACLVSSE